MSNDLTTVLTPPTYAALVTTTLQKADGKRLEKGVDKLLSGLSTVTISHQDEGEIRAEVQNGTPEEGASDGVAYRVVLSATPSCTCQDHLYRHVICHHMVSVAFSIPRPAPEPTFSTKHLKWSSGETVCHADPSEPSWLYPWTLGMTQFPECCSGCARILKLGSKQYWETHAASEQVARRPGGSFHQLAPGEGARIQSPNLTPKDTPAAA